MAEITPINRVLVDTGIIYALSDRDDSWHKAATSFIGNFRGRLIVPSPVIPEACYLMNQYLGQAVERAFVHSLTQRELHIEHFSERDLTRVEELLEAYADLNLGFVDAAIVATAERLRIQQILTTDRRHFSVVRPAHCTALVLLP